MCTKLNQLFDEYACFLSNDVNVKGSFATVRKERRRMIHLSCKTCLVSDVLNGSCGECCCMEILALMNPSLTESNIWENSFYHWAYLIALWIQYILVPPEGVSFKGMSDDESFDGAFIACKKVMAIDFGSSIEDIFEAVCKCYSGWPSDTCGFILGDFECMKPIYNGKHAHDILIRPCCGMRLHVECFIKKIDSVEKEVPFCSSKACCKVQAMQGSSVCEFLYIGQHCEYKSFYSGSTDNISGVKGVDT